MAILKMQFRGATIDSHTERMLQKLENPRPVLLQASGTILNRIKTAFGQAGQNRGFGTRWPETMQPNIPAIAKRVSEGGQPLDKYLGGRKQPLVDSSALRQSITAKVAGTTIIIGTPLSYARVNQEGGTSQVQNRIPEMIRRGDPRARDALRKVRDAGYGRSAGVLAGEKVIDVKHRPRPFLTIEPEDVQLIQDLIMEELNKQQDQEGQN